VGQGPHAKGPGPKGPRDQRALRALWAKGPFGPLGPFGAQGGRLYATKTMPNGIDNTRRKHFRMESIQAEENVRKIKQQQIRVRSMYARDTYTNSQARAVSSACRSGSKEDPRLLRGAPRYIFGRLIEPGQRPAGQVGDLRVMNPTNVIHFICMESSTPKRRRRAEGSPHCTPGRVTVTVQRALSTYVGKGYPGQNKLFIFCGSNSLKI
jgi:hypothetical protein